MFPGPPVSLAGGFKFLVHVAEDDARRAANDPKRVVFCPPLAVFNDKDRAGRTTLREGLSCRLNAIGAPGSSRTAEQIIGPATFVVRSGGTWIDPEAGEGQPKLHLHWRLTQARAGYPRALAKLKRARELPPNWSAATRRTSRYVIQFAGRGSRTARTIRCCAASKSRTPTSRSISIPRSPRWRLQTPADKTNGAGSRPHTGSEDWAPVIQKVLTAESFHEPLTVLAMKMLVAGMDDRAVANMLRGLMQNAAGD